MLAIITRDLGLALFLGPGIGTAVLFFCTMTLAVPLAVGLEPSILERIAPGILWIGALLSSLLSLEHVFRSDFEEGALERIFVSPVSLEEFVIAKTCVHWLTTCLPLCVAATVLGTFLGLPLSAGVQVAVTLMVGTPALSSIFCFGAALTITAVRSDLLLAVLVLPLCLPTLVFGGMAAGRLVDELTATTPILALISISLAASALLPFASAYLIRTHLRN